MYTTGNGAKNNPLAKYNRSHSAQNLETHEMEQNPPPHYILAPPGVVLVPQPVVNLFAEAQDLIKNTSGYLDSRTAPPLRTWKTEQNNAVEGPTTPTKLKGGVLPYR